MATETKKIINRRDTAARWASVNPILSSGEIGIDTTNNTIKIGDGVTPWLSLSSPILHPASLVGTINVDVTTGDVTVSGRLDVYYDNGGKFLRFSNGTKLFTITSGGANCILFDKEGKVITYGGSKGVVVGVTEGTKVYMNGVGVVYSNGITQQNPYSMAVTLSNLQNRKTSSTAMFANGSVSVSADGVVTCVSHVDVYCENIFYRFSAGTELFTITSSGTNPVFFNPSTKELTLSYVDGCIVIATLLGRIIYPIGRLNVDVEGVGRIDNLFQLTSNVDKLLAGAPSFVEEESVSAYNRMVEYVGEGSGYILGHITDVHSGGNDNYKHVGYLSKIDETWGFNILCHGGDVGLDVGETSEEAITLLRRTSEQMNSAAPWVFCKGNHERVVKTSVIGNILCRPQLNRHPRLVCGNSDGMYGYMDDLRHNVRTIWLNTSDTDTGAHYAMSVAQLDWLVGVLASATDGMKVVVLTHRCVHPIGDWNSSAGTVEAWRTAIMSIFSAYCQKKRGSSTLGLSWDFTNSKGRLVCVLAGDSHFNNYTKEEGVNYIVRQGYGGVSTSDIPSGGTVDSFSRASMCLFDALVVKDSDAKIIRIGAGGADRDLQFTY